MKRFEKIIRIIHTVLCTLHLGCLFFGLMKATGGGNMPYRIFRWFSLLAIFIVPMFFMRVFYLQYIILGLIAISDIAIYINKALKKSIEKKTLIYDAALWLITIGELLFLEEYYLNILYF
ncbi:MAG: hypothetical protein IJE22_00170 [Oscillibacter sp.]|nr:hypothetical protein [Oscillibacter sp.]MBQ2995637.1 hypothetical protein [Oscillibacter sp.]